MRAEVFASIFTWVQLQSLVQGVDSINSTEIEGKDSTKRVLFGDPVDASDFPYLVLFVNHEVFCSGSVIHDHWVMSAGHCMYNRTCRDTLIHPAVSPEETIIPIECYVHPEFEFERYRYDISLLKTDEILVGKDRAQYIPLPDPGSYFAPGTPATIVGWGKMEDGNYPKELLAATVEIEDWDECNEEWKKLNKVECGLSQDCEDIPRRVICTKGGPDHAGTCVGDSGGPVIIDGVVAGIVSFVLQDNLSDRCVIGSPSMHVSVADYLPWLYDHVVPNFDTSYIQVLPED